MKKLTRTRLVVAGAIVGLGTVAGAGAASAATPNPYPGTPSTVPSEVLSATAEQAPAAVENATAANSLAFTGGDAAGLAAIGAVALAAGTAITVSRRRTAAL